MSSARHGSRQLIPNHRPTAVSHNHIWISDRLLDNTWRSFVHHTNSSSIQTRQSSNRKCRRARNSNFSQLQSSGQVIAQVRYGSSTPGPLEARKRTAKKRMTGLAYEHSTGPIDATPPPGFNLKSWLPPSWSSPAGKMKWEPPDLTIWSGNQPETSPPYTYMNHPGDVYDETLEAKILSGNGAGVPETQRDQVALEDAPAQALPKDHIAKVPVKPAIEMHHTIPDNVAASTGLEQLERLLRLKEQPHILAHFLEHEMSYQEPTVLVAYSDTIITWLLEQVKTKGDHLFAVPILTSLTQLLDNLEAKKELDISLLAKVLDHAPGKGGNHSAQAVYSPRGHRIFSQLCFWFLDIFLGDANLSPHLLHSRQLTQNAMYALAKCDDPDLSCQLALRIRSSAADSAEVDSLTQLFLQEFSFLNTGSGPFMQGLSIHRCLPLAGLLKRIMAEPGANRVFQAVTIHRLNIHTSSEEEAWSSQIDYWFKALRLCNVRLDKSARDIIARALGYIDQPQLFVDFLGSLPPSQRCSALLDAWVPKGFLTSGTWESLTKRQRAYEASKANLRDSEARWTSRSEYHDMFATLSNISPVLAQEVLPKLLYLCYCSKEYEAITQIIEYLRSRRLQVPYHILRTLLGPTVSQVPYLARNLIDNDPRPFPLQHPEFIERMIQAGVASNKIHYILQTAAGVPKNVHRRYPAAVHALDVKLKELLCRAAEAWSLAPTFVWGQEVDARTIKSEVKFFNIVRVISLFREQPQAFDERLLTSLYQAIVSDAILCRRPVCAWRLRVANSIAKRYYGDDYNMSKYYTAQAVAHDIALDLLGSKGVEAMLKDDTPDQRSEDALRLALGYPAERRDPSQSDSDE